MLRFSEWILGSAVWEPTSDIAVKGVSCPETCQEKITLRLAKCRWPPWTLFKGRGWVRANSTSLPGVIQKFFSFNFSLVVHITKPLGGNWLSSETRLIALNFFYLFHRMKMNLMFCSNEQQGREGSDAYFRDFVSQTPKRYCTMMTSLDQVDILPRSTTWKVLHMFGCLPSQFQDFCSLCFSFPAILFTQILGDSLFHSSHVSAQVSSSDKIFPSSIS